MEGGKNFVKECKDFQIKCTLTENSVTISGKHKRKESLFGAIIKSGSFPPSFTNIFDYLHQFYTFLEGCKQSDISIEGNLMYVSIIVGPLGKPKKLEIPIRLKPFGKEEKTEMEIDQLKERVSKLEKIFENSIAGVVQAYLNKTIRKKMDDYELRIKLLEEKLLNNNTLKVNNFKEVQEDKKNDELARTPLTKKKSPEAMLMSTPDPFSKLNLIRQTSTQQHLNKQQKAVPQNLVKAQKSVHQRVDRSQKPFPQHLDKQQKVVPQNLGRSQIIPQNLDNSQKSVRNQSFNDPVLNEIVQEGQLPAKIIKDFRIRDFVFEIDLTNPNLQSFIVNKNLVTKKIADGKLYQVYSLNPISDRYRQRICFKFTKLTENSSAAFGLIPEDKKMLQYIYKEKGTISMGCDKGYELYADGWPQKLMLNKIKDNVVMELEVELRTNKIRFYKNGDHQQPVAKLELPESMRNKKLYPFFQLHEQGDSVELFNS